MLRLSAITGVYDPAIGSPADDLQNRVQAANAIFAKLKETNDSPQLAELGEKLDALNAEVMSARQTQFLRSLRSLSRKTEEVEGLIGRLRFASGPIWVWQADRYSPIIRKTGPGLQDDAMKQVSLSMAENEFRDIVFSISAPESDLSLTLAVNPTGENSLPGNAVEISEVEYRNNRRGEQTGDALLLVNGPVVIPQGESRQFWVRFNTRTAAVVPGIYAFELEISDPSRQLRMAYPGTLEVWNFSLPSYDVLPNNSYAEFSSSSSFSSGEEFKQAVQDMKLYGLNQIFVHPVELPRPTGIDERGKITGYDDAAIRTRITEAMAAWKGAPGEETLHFIFSLSGFQELGLKRDGYAFPNDQWKAVFAQWLDHLKAVISEAGLGYDQWMLVLGDEADEAALMQVEIPLAEVIKSLDPSIRITCNSSTILNDERWTRRYFAAFDVFQPCLWRDETLAWLRKSGKPLWVYQCDCDLGFSGRDLYTYYRVYGWDLLDKGFTGTGLWTYWRRSPPRGTSPAKDAC